MLHAFSDLRRVSSVNFIYHLNQYSLYVKKENGTANYPKVCEGILEALRDVCPIYIILCLNDLVYFFAPSGEHPTPLFLMVLSGLARLNPTFVQHNVARWSAANIFSNLILAGSLTINNKDVVVNLAKIFEFKMEELEEFQEVISDREKFEVLRTLLLKLIRSHHFCTAASVIKRLGGPWEEFLEPMLDANQHQLAEEWATSHHTENHMISLLVRCYNGRKFFRLGWNLVEKYNLLSEFPNAFYEYKESQITKLAKKGRWLRQGLWLLAEGRWAQASWMMELETLG